MEKLSERVFPELPGSDLLSVSLLCLCLYFPPSLPPSLHMPLGAVEMEIPNFHKNRAVLRDRRFVSSTPPICILRMYTYSLSPPTAHAVCHSFMHTLTLTPANSVLTDGWQHVCGYHSGGRQSGQNPNFLLAGGR